MRVRFATIVMLTAATGASADVTYRFITDQSNYAAAPGATVPVSIYLQESLTGGSTSLLAAEDGLYSFGLSTGVTAGDATLLGLTRNSAFDRVNAGTTNVFPTNTAALWADQDANFGSGPTPDVAGLVLLATLSVQAPSTGVATLQIGDFTSLAAETITYSGTELDAQIAGATFTITVPEPASLSALLGGLGILARRRR